MTGFAQALSGPPADNEKYKKGRARVMAAIRERQAQKAKEGSAAK